MGADILVEEVDGFLTDIIRIASPVINCTRNGQQSGNGQVENEEIASVEEENNHVSNEKEVVDRVLFFVVPGNPGTLIFYKDFVEKLHKIAVESFRTSLKVDCSLQVITMAAGQANHHFSERTRDQHYKAHDWLDFTAQIRHKKVYLEKALREASYRKVYIVGHSIGAYFCPIIYDECRLKDRVDSDLWLLMPYISHSPLPFLHKTQLEVFHAMHPISTWIVCLILSFISVVLPNEAKKHVVKKYATLPPHVCPTATATDLFVPRLIFNHFYMGVDEVKVVRNNEKKIVDILLRAGKAVEGENRERISSDIQPNASSVYMLYTSEDRWAPFQDFAYFRRSLDFNRTPLCSDGSEEKIDFKIMEHVDPSSCVHFKPGLVHAFPLSSHQTDIVIEILSKKLTFQLGSSNCS